VAASNSGSTTNQNSFAAPLPASIAAGNLLLLFYTVIEDPTPPTVTTPSGWTLFSTETVGFTRTYAFWKIASGSEGATVTVTHSGLARPASTSYRITGHDAAQAPELLYAANSNDPPSLTPSWGNQNNLWVAGTSGVSGTNVTAPTYPSGYSDNQLTTASSNGAGGKMATATKGAIGSSDNPAAFVNNLPTNPVAFTVAVKPA
jgi:hypothetical protein